MGNPWPKNDNDYRNQHLYDIARTLERMDAALTKICMHLSILTTAVVTAPGRDQPRADLRRSPAPRAPEKP